ncbi:hypothetical protein B7R54_02595 [Subtercola boreus]|uniref:Luciferase-like domain-containing protein n=1 Tax=Subtercola boreus TaxID=120213 RepID=A0A3E0VF09_9MICO|nr:LLM class flavin-dependent oxidoreductase [Subtercola boreus]RFA08235.1 hypothetical protein B7R54_02595 [Subtercola boreus]TQL54871.1 alkanesulfonate monooxygenase SsuD/methylene tetrahydromethanopterin reductase-like flavin-dependent oxidoreductase (luciferase family) [Subtercola boreus]
MSDDRFHLGAFTSFKPLDWRSAFSGENKHLWADGSLWVDMVTELERAHFDYVMFEDSVMVSDAYGGTSEADLRYGMFAPKNDPLMLIPMIAHATSHIGLVTTGSTTFFPPYELARTISTLDGLTRGRSGWNIVTSSENRAAQNYGLPELPEHDDRYARADDYVANVTRLFGSPEELGTMPSRQGKPVYCQAGSSPRGRDFAAKHADTILVSAHGLPAMKAYRDDLRQRIERAGRDPDSVKLLFVVMPTFGDTTAEAVAKKSRASAQVEIALGALSAITEIDFSLFDLDAPVPTELTTNGHLGYLQEFMRMGESMTTLRELAQQWGISCLDLVGSHADVADRMCEAMEFIGGDGFLIAGIGNRRYLSEVVDGLAPELVARGAMRTGYSSTLLAENLLEF